MARLNKPSKPMDAYKGPKKTAEGAPAFQNNTAVAGLRRTVMSCLLWENEFYESGETIAKRIERLSALIDPSTLAHIALEARSKYHLRHVPLALLRELVKTGAGIPKLVANTIAATIQRPDELTEFLAIYWKDKKQPLTAQMKKGLARAFTKFDAYSLGKYNRDDKIKLRDVLFLSHGKPKDKDQEKTWDKLVNKTLESPDTWEVALSGGADKKETFTRLIKEDNLGYLALLRNLRNMDQSGVDPTLVNEAIRARKRGADKVFPFRFVAAARAAPRFERALDAALLESLKAQRPLKGRTIILIDVSGSMDWKMSGKSDLSRMDAAATLGSMLTGDDVRVFTFSADVKEVPARLGMAGVEAIVKSQPHASTLLGKAVTTINAIPHDRLIVITDEQSHDSVPTPKAKNAYMINVASNQNGVGYGRWKHIDGFSERVLDWIHETEDAGV